MRYLISLSVTLSLTFALQSADPPPAIALVAAKPGASPSVEVTGLPRETIARLKAAKLTPKQWPEVFRVVVAGGKAEEVLARPPLFGTYTLTDVGIRFEPQFRLVPGLEYRAILHPDYDPTNTRKSDRIETSLTVPKPPPGPHVSIAGVYPSSNGLPENTLRLYVHFSGQVAHGDVYRHFKLVRDDGVEVKSPFLELDEELWSVDGTRLTLFFHPGRVKRGLVPREEEGPILEDGHTYTLTISGKWEDVEGRPLVSGFRKTFTAGSPDDRPVDPDNWTLIPPRANSDAPLIIRLPKPLDNALLGRLVWVADTAGKKIPGTFTVGGGECVLTFAPRDRWTKGEYQLVTDVRLEDVCGNRVGEPFEVDSFKPITRKIETKTVERRFVVR